MVEFIEKLYRKTFHYGESENYYITVKVKADFSIFGEKLVRTVFRLLELNIIKIVFTVCFITYFHSTVPISGGLSPDTHVSNRHILKVPVLSSEIVVQ